MRYAESLAMKGGAGELVVVVIATVMEADSEGYAVAEKIYTNNA